MSNHTMHRSRRGFTLTELAIVMGIVGLILGAIWVAGGLVSSSNKAQKAAQQVVFILTGYKSLFAARGIDIASADITCSATINGVSDGFFPPDMISGTCTSGNTSTYPKNPWLGYVRVDADNANQGIAISYANLPQDACIKFASNVGNTTELLLESINGTNMTLPVKPTTASSNCAAGSGNIVKVTYRAR